MPVCPSCGKRFSGFSFGTDVSTRCRECRKKDRQSSPVSSKEAESPPSYEVLLRAGHSPIVTRSIVLLNVLVFLAMTVSGTSWINPNTADALRWGADYGVLSLSGQWWRLLTSTFVHFGIVHIALNMWCLWSLGPILERLMGSRAFAITYLCSGLVASEVSLAWNPIQVSGGASGAIFGIAGAFFSFLYFKKAPLDVQFIRRKLNSLGAFILYNLIFGALHQRVDNAAHIGGLVAGLILGAVLPAVIGNFVFGAGALQQAVVEFGGAPYDSPTQKEEANRRLFIVAAASALVLMAAGVAIRTCYPAIVELGRAAQHIRAGHPANAIPELQHAIRFDLKQPLLHEMLGILLLEQNDPDRAYPVLEEAVKGDVNNRLLRHNLGLAYIGAGYAKEAKQEIGWALEASYEDRASAYYILGLCAYVDKDYEQAVKQLTAASEERADFFEAKDALARIYLESGKRNQARELYAAVLAAHKDDPAAISGLAYLSSPPKPHPNPDDLPPIFVPYSKLTAKSTLWPFYP